MRFFFIAFLLSSSLSAMAQFTSEDEVASVVTGGNTDLKTYLIRSKNTYKFDKNKLTLSGNYTYGESNEVRSAERWDLLLRYDRSITERLSIFIAEFAEANRFAGFSRRYNSDLGAKYYFFNKEKNMTFAELGYRYTIEEKLDESTPDDKDSKARAYVETRQKIGDNVTAKFWFEYIPNFTESDDYLINMEPSVSVALNKVLSLKFSLLWGYDNLPVEGSAKHDYTYSTGIIANF